MSELQAKSTPWIASSAGSRWRKLQGRLPCREGRRQAALKGVESHTNSCGVVLSSHPSGWCPLHGRPRRSICHWLQTKTTTAWTGSSCPRRCSNRRPCRLVRLLNRDRFKPLFIALLDAGLVVGDIAGLAQGFGLLRCFGVHVVHGSDDEFSNASTGVVCGMVVSFVAGVRSQYSSGSRRIVRGCPVARRRLQPR